ncbi:MAG: FAD binding domain-containing protein [Ornithinimicrobium sp.]|uniref:xanthine dehydrogenase small subunit n=1 Tax=Ornithinimicrobium sp. TaxID=1977084 RepID=UPI0026DED6DD|nr:FAD binding domain-containing protein [Ornithinimicrobium sp.]MDO5739662.1 FAD binding domain-containing protein [Ornithinimicrobium sp.]
MTVETSEHIARLTVNGKDASMADATPHTTALDWLRNKGLTGAKEGCAEGECGACAIMVARPSATPGVETEWVSINSCLVPVAALDGQEIVTAEGLGTPTDLHPVQQEMADRGGSQCGYCTPGFVTSMAAEYYRWGRGTKNDPLQIGSRPAAPADAHAGDAEHGPNGFDLHSLSGNLCRCTGYRPIRDAAYALGAPPEGDPFEARLHQPAPGPAATRILADGAEFVRPASLDELLELLAARPEAMLLAGSTDVGVELNIRGSRPPLVVAIDRLQELRDFEVGPEEVRIGAALTFSEIEKLLDGRVPVLDELFPQFASRLIRNSGTIGGNLGTASPIGDSPPVLLALEASLLLAGQGGERLVPLADYFTGYRQSVRAPEELIKEIRIPLPIAPITAFHKIAKRRFDDISSVAVGFALDIVDGRVAEARIGLGGVAATPIRALKTEAALEGTDWTQESVAAAAAILGAEGTPMSDHRASAPYRAAMLEQSLLKLYAKTLTLEENAS